MSESAGEKSFAPTAKRKQDAAKNGDVLRSRELTTAVTVLLGAAWLKLAGPWMFAVMRDALRAGFMWTRADISDFTPGTMLLGLAGAALPPVLALGGAVMLGAVAAQLGFGDGRWVIGNLAPKASRINPAAGMKRVAGPQGWIELGKSLLKLALLGAIAWAWGRANLPRIVTLGGGNVEGQLAAAWDALTGLVFALSAGLLVIALVDFPIQFLRRFFRLRMTQQEMKDETKESEGSPENKAAQRQRQRQLAMGGVSRAMREAQFVITNPTHFSVAMAYDPEKAAAPVVLAKGRGEKAMAMRELAAEHGLPTLEYPALARSVFYTTRENQVIREELYAAVAAVLAFVLSLKRGETPSPPRVEVPVALRFDADGRREAA
ncbi:EscU/YscU/HrcU family type III secretion system export apparatus switch protein [Novosphingobium sp. ZN18A2]|uniref:EscU/YscU/HrcU family type III secretion system export apparatus switch protein n=1 Tax=Novosphingobium sp. ZN18A2 TaxID=3079861 RepID=UPI0030CEFE2C